MKISIGAKVVEGPYGGGNLFVKNLEKFLKSKGHEVYFDLKNNNLDIILLINPLKNSTSSSFNHLDIEFYKKFRNKKVKVVHRINECDERKKTINVNKQLIYANKVANHTVYVSNWIKNLFINLGLSDKNSSVIMSGSNELIFNISSKNNEDTNEKFELVTHHWSSNWNKGFEFYKIIDNLLESEKWNEKMNFTYIGNVNSGIEFKNTKVLDPLNESQLGEELKKYSGYITGSINEPSGNHHIEAAQCGLPILYFKSGGTPEYCEGFGIGFLREDFLVNLETFIDKKDFLRSRMLSYPFSSTTMCAQYERLFLSLINNTENSESNSNNFFDNIFVSIKFLFYFSFKKLKKIKYDLVIKVKLKK